MADHVISREMFEQRLIAICVRSNHAGLPKKLVDRHILLKALAMSLSPERDYTEAEVSAAITAWVVGLDSNLGIDHATLRRALVDYGYVVRDRSGTMYRLGQPRPGPIEFEPEIAEVSIAEIIAAAQADVEQRRQQARERTPGPT